MGTQYSVSTGVISLAVSPAAKTCLELPTTATAGLTVVALEFSFSSPTPATPLACVAEWMTFATAGTGTFSVTPTKYGLGQGVAANVGTVQIDDSVEPGTLASAGLPSWIFPIPGMYSVLYPMGRELFQPASVNRCLRLAQSSTLTAISVRIDLVFEQ